MSQEKTTLEIMPNPQVVKPLLPRSVHLSQRQKKPW